ncbi:uncharacterized protein [Diadema setosum]|uniref:uncharacterized protein n=1 Tax=Diadema setosum TaxID=31175 RepID=UPI003B3B48B0
MLHPALGTIISLAMSVGLLAPVVADIQEIYAPQGTAKTLSCPCTSSGAETVWYWYKGATLIASSFSLPNDRYVLSNDGHNLTITVTDYDHGTYECKMILALPEIHECTKKFNVSILAVRMEPCHMDSASGNDCDCSLNTVEVTEITCSAYGFPNRPTIHFTSSDKNPIASIPSTDDDLWTSTAIIEPTSSGNRVVTCKAALENYSASTNVCVAAIPPPAVRMEPCGNPGEGSECACTVDATEETDIKCIASGFLDRPTILFTSSEGNTIPSVFSLTDTNEWSAVATIEPILATENRVVTCSVSSKQPSLTISACLISTSTAASQPEKRDKGIGTGGIIGIAFVIIVIVLIIIGLIVYFRKRLSKRATDSMLPYSKKAQGQDELEASKMIPTTPV